MSPVACARRGLALLQTALRQRVLLATIPFALLVNSSAVLLTLTVEPDGSALRCISVAAVPYFKHDLPRWVKDARAGGSWDMAWRENRENAVIYTRDSRIPGLPSTGGEANLTIVDVLQNPLSLYTTYHWHEVVSVSYLYDTDPSAATATGKVLQYHVSMPGTVTNATVSPMTGSSVRPEDGKAIFELNASQGQHTVDVESANLRWGYLLVIAYILGYVAFRVFKVVAYQVRIRPRKI